MATIIKISTTEMVNLDCVQKITLEDNHLRFYTSVNKDVYIAKYCKTITIAHAAFDWLHEQLKAGDTFIDITD